MAQAESFTVRWALDPVSHDSLMFEGYTVRREWSVVTAGRRLKYLRDKPWKRRFAMQRLPRHPRGGIPFWVIPQAWRRVVERLQANGVRMEPPTKDTVMALEVTSVNPSSSSRPYEGHHPLTVVRITEETWFPCTVAIGSFSSQPAKRYLTEVLSPFATMPLVWNSSTQPFGKESRLRVRGPRSLHAGAR